MFATREIRTPSGRRQFAWTTLVLMMVTLLSLPLTASGVEYDGRISSTTFLYETHLPDQVKEWDLINRFSANLRDLGSQAVSLHWSLAHRGEVLEEGFDKSRPSTYHGYIRYRPNGDLALSVGRHWVYGGVAASRIDGATLKLTRPGLGSLILYGGTRGFLAPDGDNPDGIDSDAFDDSGIWGALYRSGDLSHNLSFTISSARLFRNGQEEGRRLGFTGRWQPLPTMALRYEHRINLQQQTFTNFRVRLDLRVNRGSGYLAWHRRQDLAPDSDQSYLVRYFRERTWFINSFEQNTDDLRAHVAHPLPRWDSWKLRLDIIETFQAGDRGDGVALALARRNFSLGYRLQRGFGGDSDGLFAAARHELRSGIWAWVDLNQVSYKFGGIDNGDEYLRDDKSLATRLGCDLRILTDLDLGLAFEHLNNPRAESEVRFIGRVGYRFNGGSQ